MEWLRDLGFGGVMVWAADLDDFRGTCGTGPFPLLNAMLDGLDGYRVAYTYDGGAAFTPGAKADREYSGRARNVSCELAGQMIMVWYRYGVLVHFQSLGISSWNIMLKLLDVLQDQPKPPSNTMACFRP